MKMVVVMSGGGSKGSFQVGVLKGLHEKGYKFEATYGTSTGALQSSGLAYTGMTGLEKVWLGLKSKKNIFKFNWLSLLLLSDGLYNTKPLKEILNKICVGKPKIPATVCKINLETGQKTYSKTGDSDFIESVEASCCVPFGAAPVNKIWVDGGVREITPLNKAIEDGADKIVVILTNPWKINPSYWKRPKFPFLRILKIASRAVDIIGHEILVNDIKNCVNKNGDTRYKKIDLEIYCPEFYVSETDEFNPEKIRNAIRHGHEIAMKGPNVKV